MPTEPPPPEFVVPDDATRERLQLLQSLPENWNGCGELLITRGAVVRTAELLAALGPTRSTPDVVPTPDGGVQIEWSGDDGDLEVEVQAVGGISASFVGADGLEREFEVSVDDFAELRTRLAALGEQSSAVGAAEGRPRGGGCPSG